MYRLTAHVCIPRRTKCTVVVIHVHITAEVHELRVSADAKVVSAMKCRLLGELSSV